LIPLRYVLILVLAAASLTLSFVIPGYLGRGAMWLDMPIGPSADPVALMAYQDGYRDERQGNLSAALTKYRTAEVSRVMPIQDTARRAVDRVNAKLNKLGPAYGSLSTLADWNRTLLLPLVLTGVLILLIALLSFVTRRSGTEIRRFVVIPEEAAEYSVRFDRLLNEEIARIARVFRSDHLRRIGAAVTMSDPKADSELAGLETRAMAAIQQGELKSVIGFWLSEIVRQFRNIGFRPGYVLAGTVVIRPDAATASAQLARSGRRGSTAALDAGSAEAVSLEAPVPASEPAAPEETTVVASDQRQDAERLADLARVLACKFFVCWLDMEVTKMAARELSSAPVFPDERTGDPRNIRLIRKWLKTGLRWHRLHFRKGPRFPPEIRPTSWRTVHDYVSALDAIESIQ
jgi:hypothetical protein